MTQNQEKDWDAEWAGICEMPLGGDEFEEFVQRVRKNMEDVGNTVEKPLVMKVTVQAHSGELIRPEKYGTPPRDESGRFVPSKPK